MERISAVPILFSGKQDVYLAVAEKYERFILLGILKDGDKLPSVREVAGELGVNPNTVARAYCHLEQKGLVTLLPKKGAYVSYKTEKKTSAPKEIVDVLLSLCERGYKKEDIINAISEVYGND